MNEERLLPDGVDVCAHRKYFVIFLCDFELWFSPDKCPQVGTVTLIQQVPRYQIETIWFGFSGFGFRVSSVGLVSARSAEISQYRGTLLIKNSAPLGPFSRTMPSALWWP